MPTISVPFSAQAVLNNATPVTLKAATNTASTIYVTRAVLSITTHANAKFAAVQDANGTPFVIAKHTDATAAAGVPSVVTWEFTTAKKEGVACTVGKDLNAVSEASGVGGFFYVEGYEKVVT